MRRLPQLLVAASLGLSAVAGGFAAAALSSSSQATRTVTINVGTGATGPAGPQGPAGPPGPAGLACPAGFSEGDLVINHPGGQVTLFTCLKD